MTTKEEIKDLVKMIYHNHLTIETGTELLCKLIINDSKLPIGTKVKFG